MIITNNDILGLCLLGLVIVIFGMGSGGGGGGCGVNPPPKTPRPANPPQGQGTRIITSIGDNKIAHQEMRTLQPPPATKEKQ